MKALTKLIAATVDQKKLLLWPVCVEALISPITTRIIFHLLTCVTDVTKARRSRACQRLAAADAIRKTLRIKSAVLVSVNP